MSDMQRIRDLEREVRELRQRTAHLPTRVRGGSGGGAEGFEAVWYTADTKAELPDPSTVPITSLARILTGTKRGAICVVSPDGTDWDILNFIET